MSQAAQAWNNLILIINGHFHQDTGVHFTIPAITTAFVGLLTAGFLRVV
jgi:hypothetical protein